MLTNFSSGVTEWTKLPGAFVIEFVIRSSSLIAFHTLDFLWFGGVNMHFQTAINAGVERPSNSYSVHIYLVLLVQ